MRQCRTIGEIATGGVMQVAPDLPLEQALRLLERPGMEVLLVLPEGGPCGALRRATAAQAMAGADPAAPVASCMALVGPAVPGRMDPAQALRVMRACGRGDLPVMDARGDVAGLISVADLMMVLEFGLCEDLVA